MSHTILLVDADESTTAFLADQLAADGYQAVVARTLDAVFALADTAVDVVVLGDLAERRHTLGLLDDVRAGARPFDPDVLVLVLSAHAEALDVLRAFDHGADDVVAKPVSYPELRARVARAPAPPALAPGRDPARARPRDRHPRAPGQAGG